MITESPTKVKMWKNFQELGYQPFHIGTQEVFSFNCAFAMPKGTLWRNEIDSFLTKLRESGIIEKLISKYVHPRFQQAEKIEGSGPVPFQFTDLLGGFIVLGIGLGLAIVVLFIEVCGRKTSGRTEK